MRQASRVGISDSFQRLPTGEGHRIFSSSAILPRNETHDDDLPMFDSGR